MSEGRPVCCDCEVEMLPARNGVMVDYGDNVWRAGDRYECPSCAHRIVVGLSSSFERAPECTNHPDRYQRVGSSVVEL